MATSARFKIPGVEGYLKFLAAQPLPQVEESIPLRVLVQMLVFVGIGATDIAASTNNSVWSIPLSAIGAAWAYQARNKRNVAVKFCIAIAMIVMLVVFLNDLVRQAEDTKLLLAKLLIQLQVLHSFDLPRRKDLGYSIVIGAILIGVAATLSQTMIFGAWLALFLAIAIPVLILDYRSRLGIVTRELKLSKLGISPLPLIGLFGFSLLIGLGIFAILPRFGGYQLRSFPVSMNLNIRREVPPGNIIKPGRNGQNGGQNSTTGTGGSGGQGQAEQTVLPPLFAEEIDTTQSNSQKLKPELIMRVRSQAELFWRVLSYDRYTGKGWKVSDRAKKSILTVKREPFNYEFVLPTRMGMGRFGIPTKEVIQTYTIVTDIFPNLIPAANIPTRIYFPSETVDMDSEGGLRAPGQLPEDLTYTVISQVPIRDRTALGKSPALYPSPDYTRFFSKYMEVPPQIAPFLQLEAIKLLSQASNVATGKQLKLDNNYEKALYLTQALKQKYRIQPLQAQPGSDQTLQFLQQRGGQPTHFVTTLAMMLRSIGIPARYTVGFAPGKFNPFTGFYEVYNTDTISLVEVFFPDYGWFAFDPVPGSSLFPPSAEEDRTFSVLQQFWQWVAGFLPSPVVGFLQVVFNQIGKFLIDNLTALITTLTSWGWAGIIVGLVIVFAIAIGIWGSWQLFSWWWENRKLQRMHPIKRGYQRMLRHLAEQGLPKSAAQTPAEYAQSISEAIPKQASVIQAISQAYQDWYYGDRAILPEELKRLLKRLKQK
jgi:protein-glutamine gamma-glutamyltransferase